MADNKNLSLVKDVGAILLKHIACLPDCDALIITYGEVARRLPYDFNPQNLDHPLYALSHRCKDLGLPLISTIVVNHETLMPGAGYYKEFFPGTKAPQQPDVFIRELNRVKDCHDWTLLSMSLGL